MDVILSDYQVNSATWFYLSLLLIVAVFFRFGRVFSVRNLDLVLLLSMTPGLLLVDSKYQSYGYLWLFVVSGLLLLRMFFDGFMERRPRLEQNLNTPGLAFLGISALAFQVANVITADPPVAAIQTARGGQHLLEREDVSSSAKDSTPTGPTGPVLIAPLVAGSRVVTAGNGQRPNELRIVEEIAPRVLAILSHLAVVAGLLLIGRLHFGEMQLGLAMATLYLLLPCTAYNVGEVTHVLPAALIVWAFVASRRPMVAGSLMGLACGTVFFPIFLLPLWASFYDRRGALKFGLALLLVGAVLLGSLVFTSANASSFTQQIVGSINWKFLQFRGGNEEGFWGPLDQVYRIPVFATFLVMLLVMTFWPKQKTLQQLMAHSTAVVVAIQFWYPRHGGVYVLWYLPLLLLVVFRPRLTNHMAPHSPHEAASTQPAGTPNGRQLATTGTATGHLFR